MHLDFAGDKGMASKVSDKFSLPACSSHHRLQHNKGWLTFVRMAGTSKELLLYAANRFWQAWPGRAKWEAKNA